MFDIVGQVEWERRWSYELRWQPHYRGHGVRSREVATVAQLRAVVEWARRNPNVLRCSYKPTDHLVGDQVKMCPDGHSLEAPNPNQPYRMIQQMRMVRCATCPGHYRTVCPTCRAPVFDPPLSVECRPA
ncbi:hypothetical protein [Actinoplanes sp. NPDC049316]|uniref:hypothetical protein n=1 Tax=Actinoplanes sp. NPDC049316 TaxID=3154727 RepID=UPI003431E519